MTRLADDLSSSGHALSESRGEPPARTDDAPAPAIDFESALGLIAEASAALLGELDAETVLRHILELSGHILTADAHAVWIKDPQTGSWGVANSRGLSQTYIETATREIARTRDSVISFDAPAVAEDVECTPWLADHVDAHRAEGTRSLMVAPLKIGDSLAGTIAFYYKSPRKFSESEVRAAQALGNLSAAAIRTSRLYEAERDARKEAEMLLAERKRWEADRTRLAAIVESSQDAIVSKDLNGIVTSWNAAAERIYGWKAEDIIGRSKGLVMPPDLPNELPSILARIRAGERIEHYETRRVRPDGTPFDVSVTVSPLKDSSGAIVGASTIARDITDRRRTERELLRRQQEVEALNERLKQAMRETHHRVKNNLQVIAAMVDLQVMDSEPERAVPIEELIRLGTHIRTLAAVHDVLTRYLKEEEQDQLLSLKTVFERLVPLLQTSAGGRTVHAQIDDACLSGKQATSLALVTNELVSNAVKHGHGDIRIRLERHSESIQLTVQDDGPGFPEDFDPEVAANTGLQLVIAMAETDLGGGVSFGNHARGAEVRLTIPVPFQKPPVGSSGASAETACES